MVYGWRWIGGQGAKAVKLLPTPHFIHSMPCAYARGGGRAGTLQEGSELDIPWAAKDSGSLF